jgi:hypothetical protein
VYWHFSSCHPEHSEGSFCLSSFTQPFYKSFQPQDPSALSQDDGMLVMLSGATACILGAFPSKNRSLPDPDGAVIPGFPPAGSFGFASG